VLLLHRVKTSTAFPSAHVFPGGNLSAFHEEVPAVDSPQRHRDGNATYRIAAIRETFEETGILLAYPKGKRGRLLELPQDVLDAGRKLVHGNKVRFGDWLDQVGGEADLGEYLKGYRRWPKPRP
jgi:8-oxo-dGTP pyrophosphatase MutT (NUDIX family)